MQQYFIPLLALIILSACSVKSRQGQPPSGTAGTLDSGAADPKNKLNVQTPEAIEIDSSGIFLFPLVMGETDKEGRTRWRKTESSYKEMPRDNYWNIIFLNGATGSYHLLSEQKMLIRRYLFDATQFGKEADWAKAPKVIFYEITVADYNQDSLFTADDPTYLFVTDRQGGGFRQISPAAHHLMGWQYAASVGKVFMTLRKDSDRDGRFEPEDEISTFTIDLAQTGGPQEVLSSDFKKKLIELYDRNWKRVDQ